MAGHSTSVKANWGGGTSPWGISYGKMMMWFFLISDALTFGGLLVALGFFRHKYAETWPKAEEVFVHLPFLEGHYPLAYVGIMTFILIVSSFTMVLAVEAGHRLNKKGVVIWLGATVIGGLFFLGSQVWEWAHFIHGTEEGVVKEVLRNGQKVLDTVKGANLWENEYGHTLFADFFFCVTGFHGFHVFSGVVINFIILLNVIKGKYDKVGHYEMVEKSGLYWHFVDLVWVFVFTFYYLL